MTSQEIINQFFDRKGGIQMATCPAPEGGTVQASQVIYVSIKQADWLQSVAKREGVSRIDWRGRTVGKLPDGSEWSILYPHKNSRQKVPSLQIVSNQEIQ